jgi:hypothetical protein
MKCAMKRFDRKVLRGYAASAVVLLAVLAWPSEGWSKTSKDACVIGRLNGWARALANSTPNNPTPIVNTYAREEREPLAAVLMPTCAKGTWIGHAAITKYFQEKFLKYEPRAEIKTNDAKIVGNCNLGSASGLYTFKLKVGNETKTLQARYTFVFRDGKIAQHHSSLEPEIPDNACPSH